MTEHQLERQIARVKKRIQDYENHENTLSVHGHWSLGYYRGRLTVLEDWLDDIREGKEEET